MKVDAVIVGARCAGAATALLLARAGARVLLVDKGVYGSDTMSTHALMRGAILQLHRWGVLPAIVAAGTPPVHSTTFSYREQDVTVPIEPRFGVSALYAPRRALLDRTLVDAAADSGAEVSYGVRIDDVIVDRSRARARDHGCCGRHTSPHRSRHRHRRRRTALDDRAARWCGPRCRGAALGRESSTAIGKNLPVDGYYWRFQTGASIGAIPTNDGATCVFASVPSGRFRAEIQGDASSAYRRLIREVSTEFDARLDEARQVEPVRGFGGHVGFIKRGAGAGWALVGDAGYFKDPAHRARHHRRIARCGIAGARDHERDDGRICRLRDDAARSLAPAVRHHRRHRVVCLDRHRVAVAPSRIQRRNVARGARACGAGPVRSFIAVGERVAGCVMRP